MTSVSLYLPAPSPDTGLTDTDVVCPAVIWSAGYDVIWKLFPLFSFTCMSVKFDSPLFARSIRSVSASTYPYTRSFHAMESALHESLPGSSTFTVHSVLTFEPSLDIAVILTIPAPRAVILPFCTDTLALSELDHTRDVSFASAGVIVALISSLSPTLSVMYVLSNEIPVTFTAGVSVSFPDVEPVVEPVEPVDPVEPVEGSFVSSSVVMPPPDSPLIVLSSDDTSLFGATFCTAFSSSVPLFFTYR